MAKRKEWFSIHRERCKTHVSDVRLSGQVHNNVYEALTRGMQVNHNSVCPRTGPMGGFPLGKRRSRPLRLQRSEAFGESDYRHWSGCVSHRHGQRQLVVWGILSWWVLQQRDGCPVEETPNWYPLRPGLLCLVPVGARAVVLMPSGDCAA
jgi:hypothetical protein